eukprot:304068_1
MEKIAQKVATQAILDHAKETENKLDETIQALDEMGEDDFECLRERRRVELEKHMRQVQEWKHNGHGRFMELGDQSEFFDAVKHSKMMAIHFYRPTTKHCAVLDSRMAKLAPKHLETRYCKINAEKSPYLCEKLDIEVMPTLLLVKDSKTVHQIRGFDEMGGTDDFHEDVLAWVISVYQCGSWEGEPPHQLQESGGGLNRVGLKCFGKRGGGRDDEYDSDYD